MNRYQQRSETVDGGALYEQVRADLVTLIRSLRADELELRVPATPEWRVRDVFAHVVGLVEDLNASEFGAADPDAWTRAQVDRHRGSPVEAVIEAWDREAPAFEDGLRLFGYQVGNHFVGDLFIHSTDIRAPLARSVDRESEAMWVSLDWYLDSFEAALCEFGLGALEVITEPERRVVGDGAVVATVSAEPFEMLRACAGRRSAAQIEAFAWTGDTARFLPNVSCYSVPTTDVED